MTTIRTWRLSLVASSLLAAFGTAVAQQPAGTPSKAQAAPTPDIQSADPKSMVGPAPVRKAAPFSAAQQAQQPLQLGSFDFYPEISVAEMWDSNVFAENENLDPTSDWAMLTSLQASLKSNWDRHALNFAGGADWTNYRGEQVGAFLNTKSQNTNLALLKDLLADGKIVVNDSVTLENSVTLQALLIGSASDKTIPISEATVFAVYTILGATADAATIRAVADAADDVREAVLFAHDN